MNWIETTVGEFCPFIYGKGLPKTKREAGPVPVYGSNGCVDYHSESHVKGPGIIIGRKGSVGAVHLSEVPFWPIDTSFYLGKDSLEELKYTYYLLKSLGLEDMNSDSAVPGLNRENAHALPIRIPEEKKDREAIGRWISMYDERIELNRQTNQTLEHIAQAIFKSWFIDFEPTRAKAQVRASVAEGRMPGSDQNLPPGFSKDDEERLVERAAMAAISGKSLDELDQLTPEQQKQLLTTAALFPDALVDAAHGSANAAGGRMPGAAQELGGIPEGWKVKQIGDVVERLKPPKRYTKKQVESFGLIPVYEQGADILLGYHNDEPGFRATPEKPLFIFGDHTCVIHLSCDDFDISQNVIPLSGLEYPTTWVYYAIQGKQEFQEYRRHWSEFIIKNVVCPKQPLAEFFSEIVTTLYEKKEQSVRESKELEQLRDALLPKLLSGELHISSEAAV